MNATLPPTLAPGTRHRVTIEDVAFGGQGVARIGGCAVFVPFAWLDEVVDVEITERKKQFARRSRSASSSLPRTACIPPAPTSARAAVASTSMCGSRSRPN